MIKNMKLEKDDRRNCLENCLFNISLLFNVPFYPIYTNEWSFNLKPNGLNGTNYDINIINRNEDTFLQRYQTNCGISYERMPFPIKKLDSNSPCDEEICYLLRMDLYDCRWSPFYKMYHYPHYVFIVECDIGGASLHCADPFYSKKDIDFSDFQLIDRLIKFEKKDRMQEFDLNREFFQMLPQTVQPAPGYTIFDKIREFAYDMASINDIEKIRKNEKIDNVFLVQRITNICGGRHHYAQLMKITGLQQEALLMEKIAIDWSNIRYLLIKAILTNKVELCKKISSMLLSVADTEQELYETIMFKRSSII